MLWPAENTKVGRGDIIVFRDPEKPESLYVKRAVAIEGNTVEIREGNLFLDGLPCCCAPIRSWRSMAATASRGACGTKDSNSRSPTWGRRCATCTSLPD